MRCPYCNGTGTCKPTVAARMRAARDARNLTQEKAAPELGISRAQLANIESGRSELTIKTLGKAADLYGKSTDWLMCRTTNGEA